VENSKDTIQVVTEQAADHLGKIAEIVTTAIRDVARELGAWFNDVVELREAEQQAQEDKAPDEFPPGPTAV
jgi:phenylpyruvate tautomerase PptA (4-oxalocrotonate tautomerase family)